MKYHVEFDVDFERNRYQGLYIAIEGIDGSGKTTQVANVAQYYEVVLGKSVITTREPRKNTGVFGELIRGVLSSETKIPPVALQYLFSADRAIHHGELVIPSLKMGKVVVSDRCFWSAVAYGLVDRMGKEKEFSHQTAEVMLVAQSILSMYHQFIVPDHTFYLDVSVDTALQRLSEMKKQKELYENRDKLEKVILGYKWLASQFPKEITVIDGEKPVEEVTSQILQIVNRK